MSTIRSVAQKAGVSIATVSRVVNGSTAVAPELRDRVLEACEPLRLFADRRATRHGIDCLGLYRAIYHRLTLRRGLCDGIVTAMLESEYDINIVHLRRDKSSSETYTQFFLRKGIRGAVLRSTLADRDIARTIADEGFPAVVLGDHFAHPRLAFAYNESRTASIEGMEHLLSLGHKRIAFAANDTDDGDHLDRLEAYRTSLKSRGFYDEQLEFRVPAHRLDGAQLMRRVMSLGAPPTAIFIADPLISDGAIIEAHKVGLKIPEELSILGFDDTDMRRAVFPTMTAVCQDSRELGRLAFELLIRHCELQPGDRTTGVLGSAWLEINHSTGRAPARAIRVLPSGERLETAEL